MSEPPPEDPLPPEIVFEMQISTGLPLESIAHSRSAKLAGVAPNEIKTEIPITTSNLCKRFIKPPMTNFDPFTVQASIQPSQYP